MTTFILRRFGQAIASIFFISLVLYTYFLYYSPFAVNGAYSTLQAIATQPEEPEFDKYSMPLEYKDNPRAFFADSVKSYQEVYKLDQPWPLNFILWVFDPRATIQKDSDGTLKPKGIFLDIFGVHIVGSGMLTGDVGSSSLFHIPSLGSQLTDKWTNSLLLMSTALFFSLLIAIPVGIISAINKDSALDTVLTFLTFIALSIPTFMLAFMLSAVFGIFPYNLRQQPGWDWFPMLIPGYVYTQDQEGNWINRIYHLILPVTTLALAQGALLTRHVRSSLLETFNQDYIRTAFAKGMSIPRVVVKHALRNALLPLITVVSLLLPTLISGSMIIERVFSYPGIGNLFFQTVRGCSFTANQATDTFCPPFGGVVPDFTNLLGLIVIMVATVAFASMLADILYVAADPRVTTTKQEN
jgi:peptide/nickel transport system permease protein